MGTASSYPRVEVDQARLGDRILSADPGKIATMPATFNCYTTLRNSAWARKVPTLLILSTYRYFDDQHRRWRAFVPCPV